MADLGTKYECYSCGAKFYDLGKVNYWGPQSTGGVDFNFDARRRRPAVSPVEWVPKPNRKVKGEQQAKVMACGGGDEQMADDELEALAAAARQAPAKPAAREAVAAE